MKFLKYLLIAIGLLLILGFIGLSFYPGPAIELNTAGQFDYPALKDIELNAFEKKKQYVAMPDGTQIATNLFLPTKTATTSFPTIFVFTPYNRSMVLPAMKWYEKAGAKAFLGTWGPVFDVLPSRKAINTLTSSGYAIVVADMRGTGASSNHTSAMSPAIKQDGIDMVNWIAKQTWSDGKVGMMGPSYLGWIQLAIASEKPEALKCISPSIMGMDLYSEAQKQGGILMTKWIDNFDKQLRLLNLNANDKTNTIPVFPAEPVIDEDGDGEIIDEIPLYANGDATVFTDEETPTYSDGNIRTNNQYFKNTKDHLKNIWTREVVDKWQYRDDSMVVYADTLSIANVSPAFFVPGIKASKVPVLLTGGWFDGFEGITKLFASIQDSNPAHLVMTPRFHVPMDIPPAYQDFLDYQGSYEDQILALQMRFFDYYLKGVANGFTDIDPVQTYTPFKGWEGFKSWPPSSTDYQTYFLQANQQLGKDTSEAGQDNYTIDFSHASGYDAEGDNRWNMAAMTDTIMMRTELDEKCLVYETTALTETTQITGHPIIELTLSANQADADIYVYLSDVDEAGNAYYVSEGELRAGWHRLVPDDTQVNNLYDVKPDLPWHSFNKGDYDENPLADGEQITMKFDLTPTSWLFKKGHKIRMSIAGADYTNFELNPTLCPDNVLENCKETTLTIHRGGALSKLELPVINNLN